MRIPSRRWPMQATVVFSALAGHTDLVVAIGREGKEHPAIDETTLPLTAAMAAKMKTPEAREAYRRRKWLAEPPNGWIKNVLAFRQFSMRGLHRVQAGRQEFTAPWRARRTKAMQGLVKTADCSIADRLPPRLLAG